MRKIILFFVLGLVLTGCGTKINNTETTEKLSIEENDSVEIPLIDTNKRVSEKDKQKIVEEFLRSLDSRDLLQYLAKIEENISDEYNYFLPQGLKKLEALESLIKKILNEGKKKRTRNLQENLNKVMKTNLTEDGIMGSQTKTVLKNFQKKCNIYKTGEYDPKTRTCLHKMLWAIIYIENGLTESLTKQGL